MQLKIKGKDQWCAWRNLAKLLCCIVILVAIFGATAEAQAAGNTRTPTVTVMVVSRLVLWARPSVMSRIVAILHRGREFTVFGRSVSGRWIYGMTDMGTVGWLPSRGFLMLHPEVSLRLLPIFSARGRLLMMPATGQMMMPTPMPTRMGY